MAAENDSRVVRLDSEAIRCLLSAILLVITDSDTPLFRERVKTLMDKRKEFFSSLLTEQQLQLIRSRLGQSTVEIDSLLADPSEANFQSLVKFVEGKLKDKSYSSKLIELILSTFDRQCLSLEQTRQLTTILHQHGQWDDKSSKAMLQFLLDLLGRSVHRSPVYLLNQIETEASKDQTRQQIITMLQIPTGNNATAKWKKSMVQLLLVLFNRDPHDQQLRKIAQESAMLRAAEFQEQLKTPSGEGELHFGVQFHFHSGFASFQHQQRRRTLILRSFIEKCFVFCRAMIPRRTPTSSIS